MTSDNALWLAMAAGVVAILYGLWSVRWINAQPAGNARMQEIAAAIQAGARAYLNRQYTTIGIVGVVLLVVLGLALGWGVRAASPSARSSRALAGYIGMNVSVRANVRTAQAAQRA
jgi:K(+)-stimulated pyrophosphate-energized sodium pump